MQTSMSFKFTPSKDDYITTMKGFTFTRRNILLKLFFYGILFAAILVGFRIANLENWTLAPVLMVVFIIALLFQYVVTPLRIGQQIENNERLRSEITCTVDESGLKLATKFGESLNDWGTFHNFKETKGYFMIFYSTNQNYFQFMPKRAFASAELMDDFRQILTVNLEKARSQVVEQPWLVRNRWKIVSYAITIGLLLAAIVVTFIFMNGAWK
jgi:YcxB-like protein